MKQINIQYKGQKKELSPGIYGPFYLITDIKELEEYWKAVKSVRFKSAFQFLLEGVVKNKLPLSKLDHIIDENRLDYGEQKLLMLEVLQCKKSFIEAVEYAQKISFEALYTSYFRFGTLVINENGGIQPFSDDMVITTMPITVSFNDKIKIDLTKAVTEYNTNNQNSILILENSCELSLELHKRLWERFSLPESKYDRIFNFKDITKDQTIELLNRIREIYQYIVFETQFVRIDQLKTMINLFSETNKTLNFYILSSKSIYDVLKENCSEDEIEKALQHSFTDL